MTTDAVARLVAAGEPKHEPRPVRFHLADDRPTTFAGFADGSTWNGFDNVSVTPETRDEIVADLSHLWSRSDAEGALSEWLSDIDTLPVGDDGLVSLGWGYCTTICTAECVADHGRED